MVRIGPYLIALSRSSLLMHGLIQIVRHVGNELRERLLLHLTQHAVEIEVIQLQIEIGGHKTGEAVVVVLFVDVEKLFVSSRHDAEAVLTQVLRQGLFEVLQLGNIHQITHVHPKIGRYVEVILLQFVNTRLHTIHKGLLLICKLQSTRLAAGSVVELTPGLVFAFLYRLEVHTLVEFPHQRVIPRSGRIDTSDIGILEGIALSGCWCTPQHAQITQTETRHVHIEVETVFQLLYINRRCRQLNHTCRFLVAGSHQYCQTDQEK